MTLFLSFFGARKKSFFSREIATKKIIDTIELLAGQNEAVFTQNDDDNFIVELCPAGIIEFSLREGKLEGDTQTNIAGPGFHKAAVGFLDQVSTALKIDFDVEDETTYCVDRNFKELQNQHTQWLVSFLNEFINRSDLDMKHIFVGWPHNDWTIENPEGFVTAMGIYSYDYCKQVLSEKKTDEFAKNYFLWFNNKKDAFYYRGAALYLMWNNFCWMKPRNQAEAALAESILSNLATARKKDSSLALPLKEWEEIATLAGRATSNIGGPNLVFPVKIGYRRMQIIANFPGGWRALIPGSMIVSIEDDEYIYKDEHKQIGISSYVVDEENPSFISEKLLTPVTDNEQLVEHQVPGYSYKAKYRFVRDKEAPNGQWVLTGQITGSESIAVVIIKWKKQEDSGWALNLFKSIQGAAAE